MKKTLLSICLAAFVAFVMSSCSTSSNAVHTEQFPKYVPIDKLLSIEMGSTYDDVVKYLGCAPIDLVSRQKDGYSIYLYKYRIFYRDLEPRLFDQKGSETSGTESYYGDLKDAYLFFKGGKLMDIQTENGFRFSADWVMINNTLYNISKDGTGYNTENMHRDKNKDVVPKDNAKVEEQPAEQQGGKMKLPFFKSKK
jgi:hypothetical protein